MAHEVLRGAALHAGAIPVIGQHPPQLDDSERDIRSAGERPGREDRERAGTVDDDGDQRDSDDGDDSERHAPNEHLVAPAKGDGQLIEQNRNRPEDGHQREREGVDGIRGDDTEVVQAE